MEEAEDPACVPIFWISKWVDYSDKYGLGYQLCDNSVGVLFNDCTRMIMYADGDSLQYIDKMAAESYLSVRSYPATLSKKITLLNHWFRTKSAICPPPLSNGTVQINFFQDHTKLILCPLMGAVSFIDEKREFRTYKMSLIEEFGCCKELASRMRYARLMVEKLLACKSSTPR
ncbi:hypothetical protein J4Q44_G00294440 [Coregonus suidteri]|uniref:POLO box domain-containing protein n=1 Tax=Coregonus suidteri TaxID=861788 RepID=A0AAN8LA73_9TELE